MTDKTIQQKANPGSRKLKGPTFIATRMHQSRLRALKDSFQEREDEEDEDPPGQTWEFWHQELFEKDGARAPSAVWLAFMGERAPEPEDLGCWPRPGAEAEAVRIESEMRRCWIEVQGALEDAVPDLLEMARTDIYSFIREFGTWRHCVTRLWHPQGLTWSQHEEVRRTLLDMVEQDPVSVEVRAAAHRARMSSPEMRDWRKTRDSKEEVRARNAETARARMRALRQRQREFRRHA